MRSTGVRRCWPLLDSERAWQQRPQHGGMRRCLCGVHALRAAAASAEVVHSDAGGSSTGTLHGELKRYRRGECMHAGATAGEAGRASSAAPRPGAVPGGAACLGCVALGKQLRAIARVLVEHALDHSPHLVDHACTHGLRTQRSHHRRVPQCRPPQAQRRPNGGQQPIDNYAVALLYNCL